jgi:hypothetical protein
MPIIPRSFHSFPFWLFTDEIEVMGGISKRPSAATHNALVLLVSQQATPQD